MNKIVILLSMIVVGLMMSFTPPNKEYKLSANADAILSKLKETADKTVTIEADFVEEMYLAALAKPQVTKGKFYYENDDKMRWQQQVPYEYIILINEESLRIKNNGKEQKSVGSKKMAKKINAFMLKMIKGDYQDDKKIKTTCYESSTTYLLEMVPTKRPMNRIYTKFEMYFSKKTNRLESIIFYQPGGDKKITTFSHQKYNSDIDDTLFTNL